jgi:molecular chaperone GrpE
MSEHDQMNEHDHGKRPADAATGSGEEETPRSRVRVTDRRHSAKPEPAMLEPSEADPSGPATEAEPEDELARTRREAAEYRDHLLRLQAEFDNFRKRTLREQTGAVERAAEPLMRRLLDVLDDFDLALMAAERTPDLEQFMRGVEIVYAKLTDILAAEGLERIDAKGRPFDPELHEALMHAEGDGDGELVVDDVFRKGYTLKGRVIRPAGVRVTRA